MLSSNQDVLIIGGGVIGCSVAYYLAKAGVKVTLIERGRIGAQASNAASGALAPSAGDSPYARLGRESLALFQKLVPELKETCGIDVELVQCGQMDLAFSDKEAGEVEGLCYQLRDLGADTQWLDRQRVHEVEPEVSGDVVGAMFTRDVCRINNQRLTEALVRSAKWLGAEVRQDAEVVGLIRSGPRVTGVRLAEGEVYADHVVLAAGPWSRVMAEWLGVDLPVRPVRGQNVNLKPAVRGVWTVIHGSWGILVPRNDGTVIAGATVEDAEFDSRVTAGGVGDILSAAGQMVPSLRDATLNWTVAGLRPGSPDDMPILGPMPGWTGIFLATGHYRNGILLSPITGKLTAELITGTESELLSEFTLTRFKEAETVA